MSNITEINANELSALAGTSSPDTRESAGATWLAGIRDDVAEMIRDGHTGDDDVSEHADSAVSIYTHERMRVVVDLAIYDEDIEDYAGDSGQVSIVDLSGLAQYVVAERLIRALLDEYGTSDDESDADGE